MRTIGAKLLVLFVSCAAFAQSVQPTVTYHQDYRKTIKLEIMPKASISADLAGRDAADAFLAEHGRRYGLTPGAADLAEPKIKKSLLGTHVHYPQTLYGIPVEGAEIIVSVTYEGRVYQVYNNLYPAGKQSQPQGLLLNEDDALDVAWNKVGVHGELQAKPEATLVYLPRQGDFQLVYRVMLDVAAPHGAWRADVDALTGEVLSVKDTHIYRKPKSTELPVYDGPVDDRIASTNRFLAREAARQTFNPANLAAGTGMTFDPDPRTTLNDSSIEDNDPAGTFTDAYFQRDLLDITENGGVFSLTGPWVNISEHSAPVTPPSTTMDGNWTALRGDNAFNDSMTYFHLDQNQRYIQSLGFMNETGVQFGSIATDTDGLGGQDNSSYNPGSNRMQFGHGCVDDNEDADVILHEYGHAINFSINENWGGGDTGAMGEGFGDYWAGSYSISTPNGMTFHPEWVYSWDGHGDFDSCWNGRLLNRTNAIYDPNQTYGAHGTVGGITTDEYWSSPLFASLLGVIDAGGTREEADQIILQGQFGLGSGLRMSDLSVATVVAAQMLYPEGPHPGVFAEKFVAQNMVFPLEYLSASLDDSVENCDNDGVLDQGETGLLTVRLKNNSGSTLSGTTAMITSTADVTIANGGLIAFPDSQWPDMIVGTVEVTLNQAGMGPVSFDITYANTTPEVGAAMVSESFTVNMDQDFTLTADDVEGGNRGWSLDGTETGLLWDIVETQSNSGTHAWFVTDFGSPSATMLITPPVAVNATGDFIFTFQHRHRFESPNWDGGVIELSTNGSDWTDIGASATPGYNGTLNDTTSNPIAGRPGFVADSPNYPAFTEVTVNLGTTYAGQTVQIRWLAGSDDAAGAEGWFVDDVSFPTVNSPVFPEILEETTVCSGCLTDVLQTIRTSAGAGEWPGSMVVTDYVSLLNTCNN